MENTSGQGKAATVPAEIVRWNWGAFLLNWIWGIGNNTFIALLMFVPLVNLVMPFVLGAKGNSWAWRNKRWESIEQFKTVQRKWAKWGIILIIATSVALFFAVPTLFKSSEVFQLALAKVEANQEAIELIGRPISTGFPMGSIQVSGPRGNASLSFGVSGPKGKGTVYMEATKDMDRWRIDHILLEQEATGHRIDLNQ